MRTAKIIVMFHGTGMTFRSFETYYEKKAIENEEEPKSYAKREMEERFGKEIWGPGIRGKLLPDNDTAFYNVEGPGMTDIGNLSIADAQRKGFEFIKREVEVGLRTRDNVIVKICGHSRGSVSASLVASRLQAFYEDEGRVEINLIVSDPYAGPINRLHKEMAEYDTKGSGNKKVSGIVIYSMGTQFNCTPMEIKNAEVIIMTTMGHNDSNNLIYDLPDLSDGIYIDIGGDIKEGKRRIISDGMSFKKYAPLIFLHEKRYSGRETILKRIIFEKLGLTAEGMESFLESLPNYQDEINKLTKKISSASNLTKLRQAVEYTLNLFGQDGNFFGIINTEGKFYTALTEIDQGLKNPAPLFENILERLERVGKLKKPFKRKIMEKIIDRIRTIAQNIVK
ncbi:MAG: hypothetical protein LBK29_00675 [Oscillospiraceae bacterium]|jgi:hypothetical protein|nr:hypothetical protein [Oscillospiraceae bacterium]